MSFEYLAYGLSRGEEVVNPQAVDRRLLQDVDNPYHFAAICDPNLKILNLNAKFPGARHDSYIWSSSEVGRVMQRNFENGNHNMFLIGDSGYLLKPWLITPLANQPKGN